MTTVQEFYSNLRRPFNPNIVKWRVGSTNKDKTSGMALAYVDVRTVENRLDEVCGPAGWECNYNFDSSGKTVCNLGLLLPSVNEKMSSDIEKASLGFIWKADGAGDTDYEADKGALSDALKRAAVRFGVGRYLYYLPSPWVEIEQKGRSYLIKKSELSRLEELLRKHSERHK